MHTKIRAVAKEKWYEQKCTEIQELMAYNDNLNPHKKKSKEVASMCETKREH